MCGTRLLKRCTIARNASVVECVGLTKEFDGVRAIEGVDLALERGRTLALVGPSGCGKTTLLRLLAGLETPSQGTVVLGGRVVASPVSWEPPEARRVGMVFQDYALFPHLTVAQNVVYGLNGWSKEARERRMDALLEMVRLQHVRDRYPHQLSGGEQQRVALARALAPRPVALLLDEPFSNLDPQLRSSMRAEVREILQSNGVTTVFVTHDQEEALYMGDVVAVMSTGKVEQIGPPETVFHHPQSAFVARFLETTDFLPARVVNGGLETEIGRVEISTELPPGTAVEVMVRPDCVSITPRSDGQGRVQSRLFEGMHYLYAVSLSSGVVHSLATHAHRYEAGETVQVTLEPDHNLVCFWDGRSQSCGGWPSRNGV